jgi:hypothetical protein
MVQAGAVNQTPNISVPPGDLAARLRPLENNVAASAIPIPAQQGMAMTQYRNDGYVSSPAWQAVQPASATVSQNPPYVSQLPTGPSTEPVNQSTTATGPNQPNNSLLWRNPAVAR